MYVAVLQALDVLQEIAHVYVRIETSPPIHSHRGRHSTILREAFPCLSHRIFSWSIAASASFALALRSISSCMRSLASSNTCCVCNGSVAWGRCKGNHHTKPQSSSSPLYHPPSLAPLPNPLSSPLLPASCLAVPYEQQ